ncbi:type I-E CRISPR-associated protein Cas7/Cse4/CasC [Streptomyces longispororuber]|uniref:type I-E CRISPR-associated protein Cas7/Cse4/CasC n=1 Tax=Streptomyces longispororuber TaxID=68230 RepID=UPI00210E4FD1|nr:type I-E CRISPR-associated protein Cas7/Cse4/CasC [Streptomyces longispororuber]MCQ4210395.1 type I-E CRISPR-associated protein Cas7/Cse4/CasC [Streptomyces longispororuber]
MTRMFLDIHALQTVPPSNINRDDTGAPKSAIYGGVPRARVSSQAWKRATRTYFRDEHLLEPSELGVRTKKIVEAVAARISDTPSSESVPALDRETALSLADEAVKAAGLKTEVPKRKADAAKDTDNRAAPAPEAKYLVFLSARQLDGLARLALEGAADITTFFKDKDNKARAKQIADTLHSVDIALFGRMVADVADIGVDAAVQVAHALSVHRVDIESDYYTAVDDENTDEETGAGMIGTVDFNSATLYRYAAVGIHQLTANLGQGLRDDASRSTPVRRAVEAFVHGFVASLPTGKINTFGHHTLPDAVIVTLRSTRPVSYVSAFEDPVRSDAGGHVREACERLAAYIPDIERAYGDTDTTTSWVLRVGPNTAPLAGIGSEMPNLTALTTAVGQAIVEQLEKPA